MTRQIQVGYGLGTGQAVHVPAAHTAVAGQTQASGKTTTLEGMIYRSGLRAVAFVTKRGEGSFRTGRIIPPYFRETFEDRPMWEFVESVLEAVMKQRLKFERNWIIEACRNARTLADVAAYVKRQITPVAVQRRAAKKARRKGQPVQEEFKTPARGLSYSVYNCLDAYFDKVLPQIEALPYSKSLSLLPGINVMDLSDYSSELQALVIRSVLEWVYKRERDTVVIIPEAWEFIPQDRGSPVRLAAEELIRKGAALRNFVWIDSQDLAGVHKVILRSIGVWIIGVQREANEIERTLRHMLPKPARPRAEEIMELGKGEFFVCWGSHQVKTYAQPAWVNDAHAQAVALGERPVESAEKIWNEKQKEQKQKITAEDAESAEEKESEPVAGYHMGAGGRTSIDDGTAGHATEETPSEGEIAEILREEYDAAGTARVEEIAEEARQIAEGDEAMDAKQRELIELGNLLGMEEALRRLRAGAPGKVNHPTEAGVSGGGKGTAAGVAAGKAAGGQSGAPPLDIAQLAGVFTPNVLDEVWKHVKQRAQAEAPAILAVLAQQPELRVKVDRPVIQVDGSSLRGRMAALLHAGFLDEGKNGNEVFKELLRRGARVAIRSVYKELDELAELGFITKEDRGNKKGYGYTAVPGMKVVSE